MAVVSRQNGYLFIAVPRTGCTTLAQVLADRYEGVQVPAEDIVVNGKVVVDRKHGRLSRLLRYGVVKQDDVDQMLTFCGVRNPFDSLVSLYEKTRRRYVRRLDDPTHFIHRSPRQLAAARAAANGFPSWIRAMYGDRVGQPPAHLEAALNDPIDHVVRFERLQEDFDAVMAKLRLPGTTLPRANVTGRDPDYRSYYDAEARHTVESLFALDLQQFGYQF